MQDETLGRKLVAQSAFTLLSRLMHGLTVLPLPTDSALVFSHNYHIQGVFHVFF